MSHLEIEWSGSEWPAQWNADPAFPTGIAIDERPGAPRSCYATLRYPAPGCGAWAVTCQHCGRGMVVTATGRHDDPCSVRIACQGKLASQWPKLVVNRP